MKIRKLEKTDYPDAMKLWNGADGVGINPDDTEEGFQAYLLRNPHTSFAAEENGRIIGAIMAGHDGYRGFIHHTAVEEAHRGYGVGSALVKKSVQAIQNEGINKIVLVVFKSNDSGNEFWQKQGFLQRDDLYYRNKRVSPLETGSDINTGD